MKGVCKIELTAMQGSWYLKSTLFISTKGAPNTTVVKKTDIFEIGPI